MEILTQNVKATWGDQGKAWLNQLPSIISDLKKHWSLMDLKPIDNMSYHYVARALQNSKTPVVLKIGCDEQLIDDEYKALKHFDGRGVIKTLDINKTYHALLLNQAIPGNPLKNFHPDSFEKNHYSLFEYHFIPCNFTLPPRWFYTRQQMV